MDFNMVTVHGERYLITFVNDIINYKETVSSLRSIVDSKIGPTRGVLFILPHKVTEFGYYYKMFDMDGNIINEIDILATVANFYNGYKLKRLTPYYGLSQDAIGNDAPYCYLNPNTHTITTSMSYSHPNEPLEENVKLRFYPVDNFEQIANKQFLLKVPGTQVSNLVVITRGKKKFDMFIPETYKQDRKINISVLYIPMDEPVRAYIKTWDWNAKGIVDMNAYNLTGIHACSEVIRRLKLHEEYYTTAIDIFGDQEHILPQLIYKRNETVALFTEIEFQNNIITLNDKSYTLRNKGKEFTKITMGGIDDIGLYIK